MVHLGLFHGPWLVHRGLALGEVLHGGGDLMDQEVENGVKAAMKWLFDNSENGPENGESGLYFRPTDCMVKGRLDVRALVVAVLESKIIA